MPTGCARCGWNRPPPPFPDRRFLDAFAVSLPQTAQQLFRRIAVHDEAQRLLGLADRFAFLEIDPRLLFRDLVAPRPQPLQQLEPLLLVERLGAWRPVGQRRVVAVD